MWENLININLWPLKYIASAVLSLALCISAIPRIIYISKKKRIFDLPDNNRKVHSEVIPNLGGVAIYLGFSVVASICVDSQEFYQWSYIVAATMILFITGIKDDLINVNPSKKFIAQIAASVIVAALADIRLDNLYGFFGIYELPYWMSLFLTIIGFTFVSNAFNLIDGIDGLAGTIAAVCCLFLGMGFIMVHDHSAACIAFALMGAVLGFLRFNFQPARIFMGDSGSLVIGFTIAVLSVVLTDSVKHFQSNVLFHAPKSILLGTLALLFLPVFDTFRVFITRIMRGHSPFRADRTHLHHYLLDLGFSHAKTVMILAIASLSIIGVSFLIQDFEASTCLAVLLIDSFGMYSVLYVLRKNKLNQPVLRTPRKSKPIF